MSGQDENTDHYVGVLLEDINDKFQAILEGYQSLASVPVNIQELKTDMTIVKSELVAIKSVVGETAAKVDDHEVRIGKLEEATV